jgi:membrane protein DedA with SNARE-associated domain
MSEWVAGIITGWGPLGVFFLMFLEHLFPPIPSEVILPLAGLEAQRRGLSPWLMILVGTAGSVGGLSMWYLAARAFGRTRLLALIARFGRILTLRPSEIDAAERWFARRGALAVCLGRLVPTVRTLISIPAGFARMPLLPFLGWSALGSFAWTAALMLAGFWLGATGDLLEGLIGPVSDLVLIGIVGLYLWRVITFRPDPVTSP